MFISAPSPPPTPDPYATAAAQTAANLTTAIGQTVLQNADEESPTATVHYEQIGEHIIADPQYNSSGSIVGTTDRHVPIYKRTVEYKPAVQAIFDKNLTVSGKLNDWASAQADQLTLLATPLSLTGLPGHPTPPEAQVMRMDLDAPGAIQSSISVGDLTTHLDTVRAGLLVRPQIKFDLDKNARITVLRNAGIVPGMEAYDNEMRMFDWRWNDEENEATLKAMAEQTRIVQLELMKGQFVNQAQNQKTQQTILYGQFFNQAALQKFEMLRTLADYIETYRARTLQEQMAVRSQVVNELTSLLHGGQVTPPQFEGFRPGKLDNTTVGQYVYQSAAMDMQKYQIQVQQSNQLMGGMFGLAGNLLGAFISDRRLKADIVKVADDARGFGWYIWRYVWDRPGTQRFGVMAQEVREFVPSAVMEVFGGYMAVDYGAL